MPANDPRNMKAALQAVRAGRARPGTPSTPPARRTRCRPADLTEQLLETGVDSISPS